MANEEHVALLKQGVEQWNQWRNQYPEIRLHLQDSSLSYANLSGINLNHVMLNGANLASADLRSADLGRASLRRTYLSGTNLSGADLRSARLFNANLSSANLSGANLRSARLFNANLNSSNLNDANLRGAIVQGTLFAQVDLRETRGLTELIHQGPSRVELQTVQLPQDGSAIHFLRGCGVSDEWIDFWRTTMMHPIQYHSCFISYSSQDGVLARRLHADLQDQGVRCWFAPHDMRIGDKIRPRIDKAIQIQDKLLLLLSEHSVTSDWVEHEVETALARERRDRRTILFPIRLDDAILEREHIGWPALVQNERNIGDFTQWTDLQAYQQAFERLLRDLKKETTGAK